MTATLDQLFRGNVCWDQEHSGQYEIEAIETVDGGPQYAENETTVTMCQECDNPLVINRS